MSYKDPVVLDFFLVVDLHLCCKGKNEVLNCHFESSLIREHPCRELKKTIYEGCPNSYLGKCLLLYSGGGQRNKVNELEQSGIFDRT